MRVGDRLAHPQQDADGARRRPAAAPGGGVPEDLVEGSPAHAQHREEGLAGVVRPDLVHGDDPGVLEEAEDAGLVDQAAPPALELGLPVARAPAHDLHGERAVELEIADLEHASHSPPGDVAQDLVTLTNGAASEVVLVRRVRVDRAQHCLRRAVTLLEPAQVVGVLGVRRAEGVEVGGCVHTALLEEGEEEGLRMLAAETVRRRRGPHARQPTKRRRS
jgi:hypothetical protein